MTKPTLKRVLLKISGEMLSGDKDRGIDPDFVNWLAKQIKAATDSGIQIAIVVGGGNWIRGADYAGHGIERATADYMGMLSTAINGQALMDILQANGQPTRIQSALHMDQVAEPFIRRKAIRHLEKGRVVVLVSGIGKPFMTTDTAATSYALELTCDAVLKATKVDGVYDKDPAKNPDAVKYPEIDFQTAMENPEVNVMDKAALGLAMEQSMPIIIFDLLSDNGLQRVLDGDLTNASLIS